MSSAAKLAPKSDVIPGESQVEYNQHRKNFLSDLKPTSELERTLADRVIAAAWRLKRFTRMETAFFNKAVEQYLEENPGAEPEEAMADLFISKEGSKKMRLFLGYQTSTQREFDKALSEFRKARQEREKQAFEEALTARVGFASQNELEPEFDDAEPELVMAAVRAESPANLGTQAPLTPPSTPNYAGKAVRP